MFKKFGYIENSCVKKTSQNYDLTIYQFNLDCTSLNNLGTMYRITSNFTPLLSR